jgi:gas vesicle protein
MRRFMTFLAGAMCGSLVGAVTALLLAPVSGEELRIRARERAQKFREEVGEAYTTRVAQLEAEFDRLRERQPAEEE